MEYDLDNPYDEYVFAGLRKEFGPFRIMYGDGVGVYASSIFRDNLLKVDGNLPEMLSDMILYSFNEMDGSVLNAAYHLEDENRYSFYVHGKYMEKVRAMLAAFSDGLGLETPCSGREEVYGEMFLRDRLMAVARFELKEIPAEDGLLLECSVILD